MSNEVNKLVQEVFLDLAEGLETGSVGKKIKIGLTIDGSEHGLDVMIDAATIAQNKGLFDVVLIGSKVETNLEHFEALDECSVHAKMEELLASNYIQGCVTLHYNFPIGVSTVGKVITPGFGKEMYIATTTGTTSSNRVEAMVLNAISGIVAAKADGVVNPTVGILNVEGARSVERALETLQKNGYPIHFASSKRSDGGVVMRGNDLLMGSVDVMICDSLTGNILMKMFSAASTGGSYEATGFGYGPGIGNGKSDNICIISRASGAAVIANALLYSYNLAKGNIKEVAKQEYDLAQKAKLKDIRESLQPKAVEKAEETVKMPNKEVVTEQISGIDVTELDNAVECLWKENIYAESGMGCTGPIVLVNASKFEQACAILKANNYN